MLDTFKQYLHKRKVAQKNKLLIPQRQARWLLDYDAFEVYLTRTFNQFLAAAPPDNRIRNTELVKLMHTTIQYFEFITSALGRGKLASVAADSEKSQEIDRLFSEIKVLCSQYDEIKLHATTG